MNNSIVTKKNIVWVKWSRIVYCAALVGIIVGLITLMFKNLVEEYEHLLFNKAHNFKLFFFIFPLIGLVIIHFLRTYVFNKKKNKGISEVLEAVRESKKLPPYKVPSHFFNGFLTVVFGGSTGIEVSTVVATAALGDMASRKDPIFKKYRKEFIGSAIACGVTLLFCSPLAGLFFSYETIGKQKTKVFWVTHLVSVGFATLIILLMNVTPVFNLGNHETVIHYQTIPFFIALSIFAGCYGVYMTKVVTFVKKNNFLDFSPYLQLLAGGVLLGCVLFVFPQLYGDGYHAIESIIHHNSLFVSVSFWLLLGALLLKPFATGFTLKLGGDGGVFAPSIFGGAIMGALVGFIVQKYFFADAQLINFVILGVALTVAATLHAPFTALFLTFGIFNSYALWLPLAVLVFISFYISKKIFPYTVYTLALKK